MMEGTDVFFVVSLNELLSKQPSYQWFEIPWSSCGITVIYVILYACNIGRADPRFVPSQWETSLQSNATSHWLGANIESALGPDSI